MSLDDILLQWQSKSTSKRITYSKKDRIRRDILPTPTASQTSTAYRSTSQYTNPIPFDDPSIQQIAANRANLTLDEYRDLLESQKEEEEHLLIEDRDREADAVIEDLKKQFGVSDRSPQPPVSVAQQVVAPSPAALKPPLRPLSEVSDDLPKAKERLYQYLQRGVPGLARAVLEEEIKAKLQAKKGLASTDLEWTAKEMEDILYSTPMVLLESIIHGNLALDRRQNPNLDHILTKIFEQAEYQPSIYYQQLVDIATGLSPTPEDLRRALDLMKGYTRGCNKPETQGIATKQMDDHDAHAIDSLHGFSRDPLDKKRTKNGYRKFMFHRAKVSTKTKGKGKGKAPDTYEQRYCAAHVTQTLAFIESLRKRLDDIEKHDKAKMKQPLEFPLCEVGYAKRSISRLKEHKRHTSSNYIMNLMEAIFETMAHEFSGDYEIEQRVIYLIWRPSQAEVSEIGLTKLAEGYIHNGGGFSHYPAGLSNESAQTIPAREWSAAKTYMMNHSDYPRNIKQRLAIKVAEAEAKADDVKQLLRQSIESHGKRFAEGIEKVHQFYKDQIAKREHQGFETLEKLQNLEETKEEFRQIGYQLLAIRKQQAETNQDAIQRLLLINNAFTALYALSIDCQILFPPEMESTSAESEEIDSTASMEEESDLRDPSIAQTEKLWNLLDPPLAVFEADDAWIDRFDPAPADDDEREPALPKAKHEPAKSEHEELDPASAGDDEGSNYPSLSDDLSDMDLGDLFS